MGGGAAGMATEASGKTVLFLKTTELISMLFHDMGIICSLYTLYLTHYRVDPDV